MFYPLATLLVLIPLLLKPVICASLAVLRSDDFDPGLLKQVRNNLVSSASHSWEYGTETEALLEYEWPLLSVANPHLFPLPNTLEHLYNASDVISLAEWIVATKPENSTVLIDGDGATGDPASLGVAVLLTNWTLADKHNHSFAIAASEQLEHLLTNVSRTASGAISTREDQVQLWADFVYMAPPFIAYYGAVQNSFNLLYEGYFQAKTYREILGSDGSGLWEHILLGDSSDTRHWGTGNGWAATGMIRVAQTLRASSLAHKFLDEQADLLSWVNEIVSTAWQYQHSNGTLFNVIDDPTTFADGTSTAMLASATYRLALLTGNTTLIPNAELAFSSVKASVDSDGWLTQAVDPLTFDTPLAPGGHTPEGQAFVLIVDAARRDYYARFGV